MYLQKVRVLAYTRNIICIIIGANGHYQFVVIARKNSMFAFLDSSFFARQCLRTRINIYNQVVVIVESKNFNFFVPIHAA